MNALPGWHRRSFATQNLSRFIRMKEIRRSSVPRPVNPCRVWLAIAKIKIAICICRNRCTVFDCLRWIFKKCMFTRCPFTSLNRYCFDLWLFFWCFFGGDRLTARFGDGARQKSLEKSIAFTSQNGRSHCCPKSRCATQQQQHQIPSGPFPMLDSRYGYKHIIFFFFGLGFHAPQRISRKFREAISFHHRNALQ